MQPAAGGQRRHPEPQLRLPGHGQGGPVGRPGKAASQYQCPARRSQPEPRLQSRQISIQTVLPTVVPPASSITTKIRLPHLRIMPSSHQVGESTHKAIPPASVTTPITSRGVDSSPIRVKAIPAATSKGAMLGGGMCISSWAPECSSISCLRKNPPRLVHHTATQHLEGSASRHAVGAHYAPQAPARNCRPGAATK